MNTLCASLGPFPIPLWGESPMFREGASPTAGHTEMQLLREHVQSTSACVGPSILVPRI